MKTEKSAVQGLLWAGHSTPAVTKLPTPVGIRLGTSAFAAAGWPGTFYPEGLAPRDYLSYYAQKFDTVEVDSTFYRPFTAASTMRRWYDKTSPGFIFSAKVPQSITHEKHLLDCPAEMSEFVSTMELLEKKLGPLLLQFGYFSEAVFRSVDEFLGVLAPFLDQLPRSRRYVVEIRNRDWLTPKFIDPQEWAERKLELIRSWRLTRCTAHGRFLSDGYCPIFEVAIPRGCVSLHVLLREWAGGCEPVNQPFSARVSLTPTIRDRGFFVCAGGQSRREGATDE